MTKRPRKPPQPLLNEENAPLQSRRVKRRDPEQPQLLFDPMPARIEPCLAKLAARPPSGPQWSWDIKWDGYRIAVHREPNRARILTRGGHDWTYRFPGIEAAALALGPATFILDGEAVMMDEQGRSDFGLLQATLGGRGSKTPAGPAVMMAFDLLYLDGHDLTGTEFSTRRHLLDDLLEGEVGSIRLSEEFHADPDVLIEHACKHGLEGIIGKNRDQPYRPGRTGDWIKVKCVQRESFAIVGFEPSRAAPDGFASLLLAALNGTEYVYVGSVGTGFKETQARSLRKQLDKLARTKVPPIRFGEGRIATAPRLIAEIEFRGWTNDRKLRHAAFKGIREEADAGDIFSLEGDETDEGL
ncbi:non-homologous end-joining DNA ligase [Rhizobium panacihumi]|uniref:non-homologous end-joining DNA ligase n=1 Tax=Rhizobium panacihumi TaxID=2008450 RepID=UPI003D7914D0